MLRKKKKLKQTQSKMNLADFKDCMEDYSNANGEADVVIKCNNIKQNEISLVVNFITTNNYLLEKCIVNMEEDVTLALDATYNTNVVNAQKQFFPTSWRNGLESRNNS